MYTYNSNTYIVHTCIGIINSNTYIVHTCTGIINNNTYIVHTCTGIIIILLKSPHPSMFAFTNQ